MPISKLFISINVKYEGGRGVGENILDKTTRILDFFLLLYITLLFCRFGLIPLIHKIDQYIFLITLSFKASSCKKGQD